MKKLLIIILFLSLLIISGCKNNNIENQKLCEKIAKEELNFTNPICDDTNCESSIFINYCECYDTLRTSKYIKEYKPIITVTFELNDGVCIK